MTTPSTPAGWYPDPDDPRGQRYWDGNAWTEDRSDAAEPAPEPAEPTTRPSFEPMPFEPPTFESFTTPSFEEIASGSFTTPEPPPPAAEATSALEVPGTFEQAEAPEAFQEPESPTEPETPATYSPTWASDAPSISEAPEAAPAAFATPHIAPPAAWPGPPPSAGGDGAGDPERRRLLIGYLSAVGALLLILILILVYALVIRDDASDTTSSTSSTSSLESTSAEGSQTESEPTPEAAPVPAEGEIVDGPFTISVASTERGDTISSTVNEYLEKTAVGEFFVVYLNVGNTSGDVQEFLSTLQVLNTDAGTIAPDDEASFYLGGGVVSISPGEVVETAIAFDVPIGTVASGIVVHGVPGMAGGELPVE